MKKRKSSSKIRMFTLVEVVYKEQGPMEFYRNHMGVRVERAGSVREIVCRWDLISTSGQQIGN